MNELSKIANRDLVTLSDGRTQTGIVILADISGSMRGPRFQNLKRELQDLWVELKGKADRIAFNSHVTAVSDPSYLPLPGGGTKLTEAILAANMRNPSILFVISDGDPNDKAGALLAAEQCLGEINVLFVGDPNDYKCIGFMNDLARIGGGVVRTKDIGSGERVLEDMRAVLGLPAPKAL
jgi:Mg-chelatase subunit ChlD